MNTVEPLLALVQQLKGNQGEIAKQLTMSRATLNRFLNTTYSKEPRLDTLVNYSQASFRTSGKGIAFSWDPENGLRWSIYNKKKGIQNGND
tara:strand:+ start:260 stop:532 length:273 start_codon:yes stop_codon:yes gene_type:complete